jgi:hypothetical protein
MERRRREFQPHKTPQISQLIVGQAVSLLFSPAAASSTPLKPSVPNDDGVTLRAIH